MDYELERTLQRRRRRIRQFRERINMDVYYFREKFRLTDDEANQVINRLLPLLSPSTQRNHALSTKQQILIAVRFLATGGHLRLIADAHGVSTASVSRCVHRVVETINDVYFQTSVQFPKPPHIFDIPAKFRQVTNSRMPCVFGIVDGTHVNVISPSVNEEHYVNRHDDHSINCMLVCGPELKVSHRINPMMVLEVLLNNVIINNHQTCI